MRFEYCLWKDRLDWALHGAIGRALTVHVQDYSHLCGRPQQDSFRHGDDSGVSRKVSHGDYKARTRKIHVNETPKISFSYCD
jgi:hypothetical protein